MKEYSTQADKTKNSKKQPTAYCGIFFEQIVQNFPRKSFNVPLFTCLWENSFNSFLTKNRYIVIGFHQRFTFKFNMVNFNM